MVEKILGIDLGIASLGWSVVEHDKENTANNKIIDCGIRLFTAAQTPKEKESPNKARREARGIRRLISRKRVRLGRIKQLLMANNLLSENDTDIETGIFNAPKTANPKASKKDVWELRHDALYRVLAPLEFARVLIHIAKRRGYKFIGDEADTDDESGKVKKAGAALKALFESKGHKTVGEWLWSERGHNTKKRNKSGDYEISIHRDFLTAEIDTIFETQKTLGSTIATEALKIAYKEIAFFVLPMQSIEHMVGNCTYMPEEKRAPKASPTAEKFVAIGKLYGTVVVDNAGKEYKISELKSIDELMTFATSKGDLKYADLRKFLALNENQIFKGLTYESKPKKAKKGEESTAQEWEFDKTKAEKKGWINLKGHAEFRKALGNEDFELFMADIDLADLVARDLTYYKDEKQKIEALQKLKLESKLVDKLCKLSFKDFVMLSTKAINAILPLMMCGQRYDEAILSLGKPAFEKSTYLPPLKNTDISILNPTVIRAFSEFRKVANALVRKYGSFDKVHFELARDVNTKADIEGMKKGQAKNEKARVEASAWIAEKFNGVSINHKNILKKRLYEQQDGRSAYSGEVMVLERLFEEGYCEVDHILPRSRSGDDSMANKVLVFSKENQDKSNLTPFEWFGSDETRWSRFEQRINTPLNVSKLGKGKMSRLLKKNFDESSQKEFLSRNLNDTRYMAKAIKTYCENYWRLAHEDDKLRIQVRSGKLTSELRGRWIEGFIKDRNVHTHHALDAIVIAFSTPSMVKKLSDYYHTKETGWTKERLEFKPPMENFRDEVAKKLEIEKTEIFTTKDGRDVELKRLLVSRPPRASVTGAAHKETIQSPQSHKGKGVSINHGRGMCDNGDMPRVDVFTKDGKYYLVPIYVADFAKEVLPIKTTDGAELLEDASFVFSVFKDEIIGIRTKATPSKPAKEVKGFFMQLIGPSILLNSISNGETEFFINTKINEKYTCQLNVLNALRVTKYTIDPLGYYHEVTSERRLGTITQEASKNGVNQRRKKKQIEKKQKALK